MKSPLAITAWTMGALALMQPASRAQTRPIQAPASVLLRALADPHFPTLPPRARDQVIAEIAARIDQLLVKADDPNLLMNAATVLQHYGSAGLVNTLEYWGENPQIQARLRTSAEAVVKMLAKADQLASDQADRLANLIGRAW